MKRLCAVVLTVIVLISGCAPADDDTDTTVPVLNVELTVEAQPWTIPADGASKMVIFVEYRDHGQPVADSTQVVLLHTMGSLNSGIIYTQAGFAIDTLTADTVSGLGWVIAYSDGIRDSVEIVFTE